MSGMAESSGPLPAANASNSSSSTSSSTTSSSSTTPGLPSSTPSNLSNVMRNPPPLSSPSPERGGSQHNNHPVPSSASSSSSGLPPTSPSSGPASPFGNLSASQQQQHAISPSTAAASALLMSSPPLRPLNAPVQSQSQQQQHSRSGQSTPNRGYSSASSSVIDSAASADGTDNIAYTSTSRAASRANSVSRAGMSGTTIARPDYSSYKLVVAMVGLPARGKSYLSNKLQKYLRWLEYSVKVFNVGQLRRAKARQAYLKTGQKSKHDASFFDNSNASAAKDREALAEECLENLITWLKEGGGNVGIHDATNSNIARRKKLSDRIAREPGLKIVFLESICTDPEVIAHNIAVKVSSGDPDYDGMDPKDAERDFRARIKTYEENYQELGSTKAEEKLSYCKIIDVGKQVIINKIDGYLESRVAFFLMNLHLTPRAIFLTRHGESEYNVSGKIGGDAELSPQGKKYAAALPKLIKDNLGDIPLTVWTSTLRRTIETAAGLPYPKLTWKSLDELDAGVCDGLTYEEIEAAYPEDYEARDSDKYNYRYQGGESYRDVVVRLEPVIMELERQGNILLVCHQAVLRCLYAYLNGLSQDELPYIKIPLHTVIKLVPKAFGCEETRYTLPIEAVDTFRPRPVSSIHYHDGEQEEEDFISPSQQPPEAVARRKELEALEELERQKAQNAEGELPTPPA